MVTETILQPQLNAIPEHLVPRFDPVFVSHYNKHNVGRLATHQVPIQDFRANPAKYVIQYGRADGGSVYRVTEQKCPVNGGEIAIRIYEPGPVDGNTALRPAYVNFHGGGWVFGSLATDEPFCRRLCRELGLVAFDVDYRLAPEHPYPTPVDDAWAALKWVFENKASEFHLDTTRIAVGGISAGGHISAVVAHLARDVGLPLALQFLTVPIVDCSTLSTSGQILDDCPWESYRELEFTPGLPVSRLHFFFNHFLGNPRLPGVEKYWKVSPINAPSFQNLAPALVITAEMDVLRDEARAYAQKLEDAGNQVEYIMYPGVPHPFIYMDSILDSAKQYNAQCIRSLGAALQCPANPRL